MWNVDRTRSADVRRRLRCAAGHLRGIATMVEQGADGASLLRQVIAVQGALREVNRLLLKHHLDTCVRAQLHAPDRRARESALAEVVVLYRLFAMPAAFNRKEPV